MKINFNEKKGFISDMDGVIYHGNQILPGVKKFIQWLNEEDKKYLFLTSNFFIQYLLINSYSILFIQIF